MINHLYIDNFRSFSNFEWKPEPFALLLGDNGAGKTSIFDVLETLREFVASGTPTSAAFPSHTLTAWDARVEQTFELGLLDDGGEYRYRLVIRHDPERKLNRVEREQLTYGKDLLYAYADRQARLFRDGGSEGPKFPFDWSRSAIATIPERGDNTHLTSFRRQMERISVFSPDPLRMAADSEAELEKPDRHLQQLVSWLRHLSQEQMEIVPSLLAALRETIDCLDGFRLERTGEASRVLKFDFLFSDGEGKTSDKQFTLPFSRMSEGQRNLMALYTVLHAAVTRGATLCIDEPDNYVALREIQPWLIALKDKVADEGSQCLLISHHPELIDYLAPDCGSLFYREAGGPSRAKPFEWKGEDVVRASEIVARGWE